MGQSQTIVKRAFWFHTKYSVDLVEVVYKWPTKCIVHCLAVKRNERSYNNVECKCLRLLLFYHYELAKIVQLFTFSDSGEKQVGQNIKAS